MARKDIAKDGINTRFSSTNQPANRGRKPSVVAKYIKDNGVAMSDIKALITSLLFAYDKNDIAALLNNKKESVPIGISLILKAIITDLQKGSMANLDKLLDRACGKPGQTIDVTADTNIQLLPDEAKKKMADIYESMRAGNKAAVKPQNVKKQRRVVEDDSL
jgi:hypothetical protein